MLIDSFPHLSDNPQLKKEILERGEICKFPAGTIILKEGSYIKVIPFLLSGLVKVFKEDESGQEVLLYYIKEGESCVMSFTTFSQNETSSVKGIVEEDAEIFVLPAGEAIKIAKKYPGFNEFFYDLFRVKYNELLHVIQILTFSNKDKRLVDYLESQAKIKNIRKINKTHQQIADDLGSSREVISRLLKKLENKGIVSLHQGYVELI